MEGNEPTPNTIVKSCFILFFYLKIFVLPLFLKHLVFRCGFGLFHVIFYTVLYAIIVRQFVVSRISENSKMKRYTIELIDTFTSFKYE